MKTPRELLLSWHREAEPRLDEVRREAIRSIPERGAPERPGPVLPAGFLAGCWQELFLSCRRYWVGLAAAWGVVFLFAVAGAQGDRAAASVTLANVAARETLHAQMKLRDELLGLSEMEDKHAVRPNPGPRSDLRCEERCV